MARAYSVAAALGGVAFLAACTGGPQFQSLPAKFANMGPAADALAQAQASSVPADPYQASLRAAYLGFAEFEHNRMHDYTDTIFHANLASRAAAGNNIQPQQIGDRMLSPGDASTLSAARERLMAAINAGGPQIAPGPAGRAVASFDCWMEQQEENIQPGDIAACQRGFEAAMEKLEAAMAGKPEPIPAVVTLDADVLFAFDKSDIRPGAAAELDGLAEQIKANPGTQLEVQGHADSRGSDEYNQGLSERRAASVANYLAGRGVNPARMTAVGFGENRPVANNDTEEGRALNRRVEIHSR